MVEWNIGMTFSKFDFEGVGNGEGREGGGQTYGYGGKEMPTSKEAPEDQEKEWMKRSLATRFSPSPNHTKKIVQQSTKLIVATRLINIFKQTLHNY